MKNFYAFVLLLLSFSIFSQVTNWKVYSPGFGCYSSGYTNHEIKSDNSGNMYHVDCIYDTATFYATNGTHLVNSPSADGGILCLKMDNAGNILFKGAIGGLGMDNLIGYDVDPNGNILMAITSDSPTIDLDPGLGVNSIVNPMQVGAVGVLLLNYDQNFNLINSYTQFNYYPSLVRFSNGDWIVSGLHQTGTVDIDVTAATQNLTVTLLSKVFILRYNSSFTLLNQCTFESYNAANFLVQPAMLNSLISDVNGDLYLTGNYEDTISATTLSGPFNSSSVPGIFNLFVLKINTAGQIIYVKEILGFAFGLPSGILALDASLNLYLHAPVFQPGIDIDPSAGIFMSNANDRNFTIKLDPLGNFVCASLSDLSGAYNSGILHNNGKIVLTTETFGGIVPNIIRNSNGNNDIILSPVGIGFPTVVVFDTTLSVVSYTSLDTIDPSFVTAFHTASYNGNDLVQKILVNNSWIDLDINPLGYFPVAPSSLCFIGTSGGSIPGANQIQGKVYYDADNSGSYSSINDFPKPYSFVKENGNSYVSMTDSVGDYNLYLPSGSFTIAPSSTPIYHNSAPSTYTASFSGVNQTSSNNDFAFQMIPGITDLVTSVFPFGNPVPGFTRQYDVYVNNVGTTTSNYDLKILVDTAFSYLNSNPPVTSLSGDTLIWSAQSLAYQQNSMFQFDLQLHSTSTMGDTVHVVANSLTTGENTPVDNLFNYDPIVGGPYDPNFKEELKYGTQITPTQISTLPWFDYVVHFQNTGNAPAINVHVIDTISNKFDLSSFEFISSSHPMSVKYLFNNTLDFKFDNIMLPDSNANEPLSHGYVAYRIKPSQNWVVGTQLDNSAAIYFDFNSAIYTNNMITTVTAPVGIHQLDSKQESFIMYPNPANSILNVVLGKQSSFTRVRIINALGQEISSNTIVKGEKFHTVSVQQLPVGLYFIELSSDNKRETQKFVKSN